METYEKISRVLRTDKDVIRLVSEKLGASTGKRDALERLVEENKITMEARLHSLGLNLNSPAKDIYDALIKKLASDDSFLYKALGEPKTTSSADWESVLNKAKGLIDRPTGFFLKKEKAIELLLKQPPKNVLAAIGYRSIEEMVKEEDWLEIYASLRFVEGAEWLNNVFFKQYESLKPSDFEEREITTRALSEKWFNLAKKFILKKHHNISHLKELGLIYVIPMSLEISGEVLRNFALILHYFNEIPFYSDLFKRFAEDEETFASNIVSLLRGDVLDKRLPPPSAPEKSQWMVIQRYLTKDDINDWRLLEPHINPEALHWERAERMLIRAARKIDKLLEDLSFWQELNWVGNYFKTESGVDVLVSFNLVDASMDLVKQKEGTKYLYHHQEALWNRIFMEYFGEEKMEEMMKENIIKGYFEI